MGELAGEVWVRRRGSKEGHEVLKHAINLPHLTFGGMSQAIRADGTVHVAGQVALGPDGLVGEGDARAQAEQCFANIGDILAAAGGSLDDVVRLTCFLTDRADFAEYSEVKSFLFESDPPASSTVVVAALLDPRFLLEVEAVAVLE